jgi:lipopolysaccharide transport system permease protein
VIVPSALALPGLVDLVVSLVVLAVVIAAYGLAPTASIVLVPCWILMCMLVVLGAGLWLSALNAKYRDVRHTMVFLLQVWFFATPVVYAGSLVDGLWRYLYALNPMVTVIEGFRWSLVGGPSPGPETLVSLAVVAIVLVGGLVYFLRAERQLVDLI